VSTEKSRAITTRRAVLVAGGVALLAGFWPDRHPAQAGDIKLDAAHPAPPARPARHHRRGHRAEPDEIRYYVRDGRKGVALTIDDGPSPEYTPQVLRLLAKHKVTATFSIPLHHP
jgi:peptidoglycan/xylan/chitin deacetylase (PgdA/CDA1 family)